MNRFLALAALVFTSGCTLDTLYAVDAALISMERDYIAWENDMVKQVDRELLLIEKELIAVENSRNGTKPWE